jgi:hypothetical protein
MAYTKELSDVASWFENCGIDELTPQMVSSIIRKWVPKSAIRPTKRAGDKCPHCHNGFVSTGVKDFTLTCKACKGTGICA